MSDLHTLPLIGVTACLKAHDGFNFHSVGSKYVDAVVLGAHGVPLLIPALGTLLRMDTLIERLDGLMLTGSPSNVAPHHYDGPPPREGNEDDHDRDATTLPLVRAALDAGLPLFAICRGIQELNVALGGSLHQHVQELEGRIDHRSDKTKPQHERYEIVHDVALVPGGRLAGIFDGAESIPVNSLHGQGIDRVADRLVVEATAPDGTIEAVHVADAPGFALGVQWHPEWRVLENPYSMRLFGAFGAACRERQAARSAHARVRELA